MNAVSHEPDSRAATPLQKIAWLVGQPALGDYLDFVRTQTIGGHDVPQRQLVDEWRVANDYYRELETNEAGIADRVKIGELPVAMRAAAIELQENPQFQQSFDLVPTDIKMVELEKLIVSQLHIDVTHSRGLETALGPDAEPEALFRYCQRIGNGAPEINVQKRGRNAFTFTSASSDFRFHNPVVLSWQEMQAPEKIRPNAMVLGMMVGFSSNFLSAIESDGRVVLYNGHHRAYALRALGYTHAPCILQHVTRRDELNVVASGDIVDEPALYFRAARPPLLKDFFDSRIRKVFDMKRVMRAVEIEFKVREFEVVE
jgi:hypothetical protein